MEYRYTETSSLMHRLCEKKLMSLPTIGAWSILSDGDDDHVALQSTLQNYMSEVSAKKYVDELLKFGFLVPTTDSRFTKKTHGERDKRAFDLVGTPDLSQWLTEEEIESQRILTRSRV